MRRNKLLILMIMVLSFTAMCINAFGSEMETIQKTETYKTENKDYKKNTWSQSLNINGKSYRLKDVRYDITDKDKLFKKKTKTVTLTKESNGEYTPDKTIVKDGVRYDLKSVKKNERTVRKENKREVMGYLSFDSKDEALNAPDKYTFSSNGVTALCSKLNMVQEKTEGYKSSYIDFTFTSTDKDYYEWNGNTIDGNSKNPLKGYDKEILKSINADSGSYRIGNTYWKGSAKLKNGVYTRKLRVDVQKKVPHYRVNYKGYSKGKTETVTEYVMTYKKTVKVPTGKYEYTLKSTAVYEYKKPQDKAPLIFRVGIILIAVIFAGVLFIILKPERTEITDKIRKRK